MTRLCVPIFVTDFDAARRDLALAAEAGADIVELRVDRLEWSTTTEENVREWVHEIGRLIARATVPCIVTLRSGTEGGSCDLPDEARWKLARTIADGGGSAFVDFEWAAVKRLGNGF